MKMLGLLVPLAEALVLVPLPLPWEVVTGAGSQFEAGGRVEMKPSLPCGGNISLPSQGRLLWAVAWSSRLVAPPCVVLEAFG